MKITLAIVLLAGVVLTMPAQAITVTPTSSAGTLVAALMSNGSGVTVLTSSLQGQAGNGSHSTGTFTNASATYGIASGIVLSTGDVTGYGDGVNDSTGTTVEYGVAASVAQEALLDPISGGGFGHHDVTQLDIGFTTSTGMIRFDVVFGSEEFDEFVGSQFVDAFGIYLDGVNIAQSGGKPVNINHPAMGFYPGTELDGLLAPDGNPLLVFSQGGLSAGPHTLTLIIADTSDAKWDSTVYLSTLSAMPPVPVPASIWLFGSGLAGLAGIAQRRRRQA